MVGAFVGIDSDYFSTVLPHLKTGRVSADSVPAMGDICRVLKLCYLAAELSSLFIYREVDVGWKRIIGIDSCIVKKK